MRVFCGGIVTETNTFSPIPTGMADYDIIRAGDVAAGQALDGFSSPVAAFQRLSGERGYEFVFSLYAFAQPAGITVRPVYESLRDEMLDALQAAMPVDLVFLPLHGAMVAEGYDDCETDLIQRVRAIVGPEAKIGVELDLHCDVTDEMLDLTDVIVIYKEYPHVDIADRAIELFHLTADAAEGKIHPVMATYDCRMIGFYLTPFEPMRTFVDDMIAAEGKDGVLSLSLAHCFPWGDVPTTTAKMLAVTDGNQEQAAQLAESWGQRFFAMRRDLLIPTRTMAEAMAEALAAESGPVVIADQADNAGGGAPSDSTFFLRLLLESGVQDVALGMIWDPIAVQLAMSAGVGAKLQLRLGGKMGVASGDPLDLETTVTAIAPDMHQSWPQKDGKSIRGSVGDSVALHCQGVDIIVNSKRSQVLSTDVFTQLGIDPTQRKMVVVKSTQHFYAAYAPIASKVIYMAAPGAIAPLFTEIPYQRVDTHKFPWVEDPFEK